MTQKKRSEELMAGAERRTGSTRRHSPVLLMMTVAIFTCFVVSLFSATLAQDGKKLKPEELVARHLEALGSAEARAAAKTSVASGQVKLVSRIGGARRI